MTLSSAWQNEVFRIYLAVVAGLLALAGAILAAAGILLRKNLDPVWATYRSWLVMLPILVAAILLGRSAVIILFLLLSIIAFKEFARATGLYQDWWMSGAVYASIAALGACLLVTSPTDGKPGWYGLFMTLPVYAIAAFLFVPIARNLVEGQLQAISLAILGFIYIGWMFLHIALLANRPETWGALFFLIFAVELSDVAAFTIGRLLGGSHRHPLRSTISPNKTWEGALGALAVAMALPWLMRFSFPRFGAEQLILTGLIVGVGGQLGDLSISIIKRDVGIKDMGRAIPGHGGILDRIDSLICSSALFVHMTNHFYRYW